LLNRLKHKRDFYAGGLMVLVGLGTVLEARSYNLGTLTHMGPGFFPIMLGAALIIVGVMIAGSATASGENDGTLVLPQPEWRGWLCIIAGPILFIVLGHYGGLIPATFSCAGLIASFWIGNIMLVVLNVPMIGLWVKLLTVPYRYLYPSALFFICIGVYSAKNDLFEVGVTLAIGLFGYVLLLLGFHPAPVLLGFVLGPRFEENFRRAMLISRGDLLVFVERPISAFFVALCVILLVGQAYFYFRTRRSKLATPLLDGAAPMVDGALPTADARVRPADTSVAAS